MIKLINSKGNGVGECSHEGIKLDVGCGRSRDRDRIGIDETDQENVDIVRSLSKGLPFCDRSVESIKAHNILEHLGEEFHFVMTEFWRVLKDDGILDIVVPGALSDGGMRDPTHRRHFTRSTFDYFKKGRPKYHKYMDGKKWKVLFMEGEDNGTIFVKMTPDRENELIHSPTPPPQEKPDFARQNGGEGDSDMRKTKENQ